MPGNPPVPLVQVPPPGWIDPHDWTQIVTPASTVVGLTPSGDTSGVSDTANIQAALNTGTCFLQAGIYYVSATLEIPNNGGQLLGTGGNDFTINTPATELIMAAGANLSAIVATHGWLESTNASGAASPCLVRDILFNGNFANQTSYTITSATFASPCVFTATGSAFTAGQQVILSGTVLPGGFTAGVTYWVVSPSGTTFELAATSGGTAINSTSAGSGSPTVALAQHGLVLQTFRSHVEDCTFNSIGGDGIRLDYLGLNGTTSLTGNQAENKILNCQFRTITGASIHSTDAPSGSAIFTDGFITDCICGAQSWDAINIGQAAGWLVKGCHLYGLKTNGITLNKPSATTVEGNYVEPSAGSSPVAGIYAGINITNMNAVRGCTIYGNRVYTGNPAPNAGSTIYGIFCGTAGGGSGTFAVIGNVIFAAATPATDGILFSNGSSGSTTTGTSTGNNIGAFTTAVGQFANGGTMTVTAGV